MNVRAQHIAAHHAVNRPHSVGGYKRHKRAQQKSSVREPKNRSVCTPKLLCHQITFHIFYPLENFMLTSWGTVLLETL